MGEFKSLLKNFALNGSGNIAGQIIGFLCVAYLARVLGPTSYGIFNFSLSYYSYFLILTDLGLSLYIIKASNQKNSNDRIFTEVFSLKLFLSLIALIIFYISVFLFDFSHIEKMSLLLMGFSILFSGVYIESFFISRNETKYLGISQFLKNSLFYFSCLLFVKDNIDIGLVSICFTIGNAAATFYLIFKFKNIFSIKLLEKMKFNYIKIIRAALPLGVSLFMNQLSNSFSLLYISFTKGNTELGYFSAANKIILFLVSILIIYFNSSYSTIANLVNQDKPALESFISKFFKFGMVAVIPITAGGIILADEIMINLFGSSFKDSGILFALFMPLIIMRMFGATFGAVLLMGDGGNKYSAGVTLGAIVNVFLCIVLIPFFDAKGAVAASVGAELIQDLYLYYFYKKKCTVNLIGQAIRPILACLVMGTALLVLNTGLIFKISIGMIVYCIIYLCIDYKLLLQIMKRSNN